MVISAFVASTSLLVSAIPAQIPKLGERAVFPAKVSKAQKLIKAKVLMKRVEPLTGLTELAELSIQKPHIEGKASLSFSNVFEISGSGNYAKGLPNPDGFKEFQVTVSFQVARPNRPHLFSFYVDSFGSQEYRIFRAIGAPVTRVPASSGGPSVIHFVYVPEKSGHDQLYFHPTTKHFKFSRVDIDVLD